MKGGVSTFLATVYKADRSAVGEGDLPSYSLFAVVWERSKGDLVIIVSDLQGLP